ncbi:hypothetical protein J1N35_040887 [Gossypium stocksii]|uniref:Uncharacterized protein n=1 Tax=Gossypium stocksii TaxID=47602 RepID=A0A9D3UF00_9ROSI|nr:hypothetical protein J1N35_040887 [Gossypium stocksii]
MRRRIRGRKSRSSVGRRVVTDWGSLGKAKIRRKGVFRGVHTAIRMGKGDASNKVMAKVPTGYERVAATPKFKWRKVSAVRNFLPGCGRVIASNFGLCRQIAVDQSSQGKW